MRSPGLQRSRLCRRFRLRDGVEPFSATQSVGLKGHNMLGSSHSMTNRPERAKHCRRTIANIYFAPSGRPSGFALRSQGVALVVLHKSGSVCSRPRPEGEPAEIDVMQSLKSQPDSLRSGRIVTPADHIATQLRDDSNHFLKLRRLGGRFADHHAIDGFPFGRFEDGLAADVGAASPQTTDVQGPPCNNQVHSQAAHESVDVLEAPVFHPTTRFQRAEEDLDHPTSLVIGNKRTHLLDGLDWQIPEEDPLDCGLPLRRVQFPDKDGVHRDWRQTPIGTRGRAQTDSDCPNLDVRFARFARLATPAMLTTHFRFSTANLDLVLIEHGRGQKLSAQRADQYRFFLLILLQGPILTGTHDPVRVVRSLRCLGEQFIDIAFTVSQAHKLRLRLPAGFSLGLAQGDQPAITFFFFNRYDLPFPARLRRTPWFLVAAHNQLRMNGSQRRAVRRESLQGVEQHAPPRIAVKGASPGHLLFRSRHVDLGRILRQNNVPLRSDALASFNNVRLEHVFKSHVLVVKQAVRGHGLGGAAARTGDARIRLMRECVEHSHEPLVQSRIPQPQSLHFFQSPWRQHRVNPLTKLAPLRKISQPRLSPSLLIPPMAIRRAGGENKRSRTCVEQRGRCPGLSYCRPSGGDRCGSCLRMLWACSLNDFAPSLHTGISRNRSSSDSRSKMATVHSSARSRCQNLWPSHVAAVK